MGQKVNPHGLRVGVIKDWDSKWYAEKDFADNLVEDHEIRKFLKKRLYSAGISKIEIERASDRVKIIVYTAKPGVVIRFSGTTQRPRLAVFRSNNHMYAQIIDDTVGNTLVSASTLQKEVKAELEKTNDVNAAAYLGKVIAERAIEKGITEVVFDRGGFIYQGKIKALADAAREAGLNF